MIPLAFGFGGPWDMAILGGVLIVLFGGSKIGGLGKSLGEGIKEFKKATHDEEPAAVPPATTVITAAPAPAPLNATAPAAIPAPAPQAAPPAPVSTAAPEDR